MADDYCESEDYRLLVESFTSNARSARELADAFLERDETYHAYVWLLIAADHGDDDADELTGTLEEVDQVCAEDVRLAELQVALWYHHGHLVELDDELAAVHLPMAAFAFLELPTVEQIHADPDVLASRDRLWEQALARFGIPKTGDREAVAATLAKILSLAGWPAALDITRPLGPAMPHRPHHLHPRHVID